MFHQSKKGFWGIFVGIPQHPKGYLAYIPSTWKIVSLRDVIFENKYSALAYISRPYSESLAMQTAVFYIPYDASYLEQTDNIISFAQFEEGGLVENKCNAEEDESI